MCVGVCVWLREREREREREEEKEKAIIPLLHSPKKKNKFFFDVFF